MRRVFLTMLIFVLLCGTSAADIPSPERFRRQAPIPSSFSLTPSRDEKDTLILEIAPYTRGKWHYEFQSMNDNGTIAEILTSSDASYDVGGEPVKAKLTFTKPHREKTLQYRVVAVFEGENVYKNSLRYYRPSRDIFTRIITVSNIQGTVYVFADNTRK